MKNRGLLTRPAISPLGTHKDPTPADLPNQQNSNLAAGLTRKDAIVRDQETPQPNTPIEESGAQSRATSAPVPAVAAKRYTLILKLDLGLHQGLEASLVRIGPSARSAAKRAMLLAFRTHLARIHPNGVPAVATVDAVPYRIDIRLPDPLVRQLLTAARQIAFEPKATALARSLGPHFADFVRGALASSSAAARGHRVAEPTAEDTPSHP
jgi:hypothetical protein